MVQGLLGQLAQGQSPDRIIEGHVLASKEQ
jgi:hypothetical protein